MPKDQQEQTERTEREKKLSLCSLSYVLLNAFGWPWPFRNGTFNRETNETHGAGKEASALLPQLPPVGSGTAFAPIPESTPVRKLNRSKRREQRFGSPSPLPLCAPVKCLLRRLNQPAGGSSGEGFEAGAV